MYRECFIIIDEALPLLVVVLSLVCLGLACAVARNAESARRYRGLWLEAEVAKRQLKAWKPEFDDL